MVSGAPAAGCALAHTNMCSCPTPPCPTQQDGSSQFSVTITSADGAEVSLPDPVCSNTGSLDFCPNTAAVWVRVECSDLADTPCRLQLAVYWGGCASDPAGGGSGSAGDPPVDAGGSQGYPAGDSGSYQTPSTDYGQAGTASTSGGSSSSSNGVTGVTGSGSGLSTTTWIIIGAAAGGALLAALGESCRSGMPARLWLAVAVGCLPAYGWLSAVRTGVDARPPAPHSTAAAHLHLLPPVPPNPQACGGAAAVAAAPLAASLNTTSRRSSTSTPPASPSSPTSHMRRHQGRSPGRSRSHMAARLACATGRLRSRRPAKVGPATTSGTARPMS